MLPPALSPLSRVPAVRATPTVRTLTSATPQTGHPQCAAPHPAGLPREPALNCENLRTVTDTPPQSVVQNKGPSRRKQLDPVS
jgi:hypothetical protein